MSTSVLASMAIVLNGEISGFKKAMATAKKEMRDVVKVGEEMKNVGKSLSMYVTAPLALMGGVAVAAWNKQSKAMAQVENGLRSTGGTANLTLKQLTKAASDLQNKTLFGDEEILQGATTQLLTFTNIAGEQFLRTQTAAANLATKLDGDLKSASIQLGKALNDPVANLSALSRSGIQFSEDQKKVINSLAKTGRLAEAQTLILDELEKQYGGTAEAAAKAGTGGLKQLSNTLGDIMEEFGAIIYEGIAPLVDWLKGLAQSFQGLSEGTKRTIVVIAAVAAAIGPLLVVVGSLLTALPMLSAAFAVLTGPIGAIALAVGAAVYLIIKNWDTIKAYFTSGPGGGIFQKLKETTLAVFATVQNIVAKTIAGVQAAWELFGGAILNVTKVFTSSIQTTFANGFQLLGGLLDVFRALFTGDWENLWKAVKNVTFIGLNGILDVVYGVLTTIPRMFSGILSGMGIENAFTRGLDKALEKVKAFVESVKLETEQIYADTKPFELILPKRTDCALGGGDNSDPRPTPPRPDTEALQKQKEILESLKKEFDDAGKRAQVFGTYQEEAAHKAKLLENAIGALISNGMNPQSALIKQLKTEFDGLNNLDLKPLENTFERLANAVKKSFKDIKGNAFAEIMTKMKGQIAIAQQQNIAFGDSFDLAAAKVGILTSAVNDLIANGFTAMSPEILDLTKEIKKLKVEMDFSAITASLKESFTGLATEAFVGFGDAIGQMASGLATGTQALANFGDSMLKALADVCKQAAGLFIKLGIGQLLAGIPTGAALIAAGVALSALSGAVGGSAGASGGGSFAPSVGGTGGGNRQPNYSPSYGSGYPTEIRLRAEGSDLVGVINRHTYKTRRVGG